MNRSNSRFWILAAVMLIAAGGVFYWLQLERRSSEFDLGGVEKLPRSEVADSSGKTISGGRNLNRDKVSEDEVPEELIDALLPEESEVVEDELIVSTRPGTTIEGLAQRYGAEIVGRLDGISTYRLKFADKDAADAARTDLTTNPGVDEVQDNLRIALPPAPEAVATADQLLAGKELSPVDSDSPVVIGLIDSSVNLSGEEFSGFLLEQMSVADAGALAENGTPTHGSAVMASILEGMKIGLGEVTQSGVKILPVDVYGDAGETTSYQVAQGVVTAMENGATIINMSLGSEGQGGSLMEDIVASGKDLGVVFVGAAGNEPVATPNFPAALSGVLAVTSVEGSGQIASYANYGSFVDVGLPGSVNFPFGEYVYSSQGTSMAAGVASGVAAGLAERRKISVRDAEVLVRDTFKVSGTAGE